MDDYVVLAKRLAHRGALDEIRWLLSETSAAGLGRPVGIWNVILAELVRLRKESEAAALLQEMVNDGTQPDADTFGLQVALLAQTNRLSEADVLFNSMKDRGVQPTTFACNRLMHAYARNADLKRATWLLERMGELGVQPNPFTYAELVRLHVMRGDISAALKVTDDHGDGLPPSAFLPLIRELERSSEASAELIAKLKHRMEKARKQAGARDTSYTQLRHMLE